MDFKEVISAKGSADLIRELQDKLAEFRRQITLRLDEGEKLLLIQSSIVAHYQTLVQSLVAHIEGVIGTAPCPYALIAVGSLARCEATPYSDIEYVLLFDEAASPAVEPSLVEYFTALASALDQCISAFGENGRSCWGIHIDQSMSPASNVAWIKQPEALADDCIAYLASSAVMNLKIRSLLKTVWLAGNDDQNLCGRFRTTLANQLSKPPSARSAPRSTLIATDQLLRHTLPQFRNDCKPREWSDRLPPYVQPLKKIGTKVHLKHKMLAPFTYACFDLAIYHEIAAANTCEILGALGERGVMGLSFSAACQTAITKLTTIRLRQHLKSGWADDNILLTLENSRQFLSIHENLLCTLYESLQDQSLLIG